MTAAEVLGAGAGVVVGGAGELVVCAVAGWAVVVDECAVDAEVAAR